MSLQKNNMIIRQKQKPHIEDKNYPWILGNQKRTSKAKSPDASIAIYIDIWQKIAED